MNKYPLPDSVRAAALALLRLALGSSCSVVAPENSAQAYDGEIFRDGAPPLGVRLRQWEPGAALLDAGSYEDVWVLPKATRAQLQQMREREQNFIALNGAVRLVRGWLVLDRNDLAAAPAPARAARRADPFSDRNSLVPRALLSHPGRSWGVRELAEQAGVAVGTASQVVQSLARSGVVEFRRTGRSACVRVPDPRLLLEQWVSAYSWLRNDMVALRAPVGDVSRFVRRLPRLLEDRLWALTLQAGASRIAPHASWDRVHAYVAVDSPADLFRVGERHGWEPAEDGRLVLMKPYYRTAVWRDVRQAGGIPVVDPLQLVLDLWHYPLRGREQAEHLLETVLFAEGEDE